jgi:hypothetical protein
MIPFGARSVAVTNVCRAGERLRATTGDAAALEIPAAGHPSRYSVQVGRVVGDAEHTRVQVLFVKPFDVPTCA